MGCTILKEKNLQRQKIKWDVKVSENSSTETDSSVQTKKQDDELDKPIKTNKVSKKFYENIDDLENEIKMVEKDNNKFKSTKCNKKDENDRLNELRLEVEKIIIKNRRITERNKNIANNEQSDDDLYSSCSIEQHFSNKF